MTNTNSGKITRFEQKVVMRLPLTNENIYAPFVVAIDNETNQEWAKLAEKCEKIE
jgi:hypothetical protein